MAEFDSVIPAGESGKLVAKVHTSPTQHGKITKSIAVTTDAPGAQNIRLTLTFNAHTPIIMRPASRLSVNTVEGKAHTGQLLLHRDDGEPLVVEKTEVLEPGIVQLRVRPGREGDSRGAGPGDVWLEATVSADAEPGRRATQVKVYTNHPERRVLEVPVSIWVRGLIEPRPDRVNLWLSEDTQAGRTATFRLMHNGGKGFQITEIENSRPDVFQVVEMTSDSRTSHTFKVVLAEGAETSALRLPLHGTIRMSSDDVDRPTVEVPVTVSQRVDRLRRARPRPPSPRPTPAAAAKGKE